MLAVLMPQYDCTYARWRRNKVRFRVSWLHSIMTCEIQFGAHEWQMDDDSMVVEIDFWDSFCTHKKKDSHGTMDGSFAPIQHHQTYFWLNLGKPKKCRFRWQNTGQNCVQSILVFLWKFGLHSLSVGSCFEACRICCVPFQINFSKEICRKQVYINNSLSLMDIQPKRARTRLSEMR